MKLFITLGNAAFEDDNKPYEVARILDEAAQGMEGNPLRIFSLFDSNGNKVGAASVNGPVTFPKGEEMVSIEMETDNAAFEDSGLGPEVARILHEAADKIRDTHTIDRPLHDYNGNKVGTIDETVHPVVKVTRTARATSAVRDDDTPSP